MTKLMKWNSLRAAMKCLMITWVLFLLLIVSFWKTKTFHDFWKGHTFLKVAHKYIKLCTNSRLMANERLHRVKVKVKWRVALSALGLQGPSVTPAFNSKCKYKKNNNNKNSRRRWSFHIVVLQRAAKKCTNIYNARAQPLSHQRD